MHQTDIMIDIETLGGPPDAVPVTIGVAQFRLDDPGTILDKFQIHVHPGTAQKAGLNLDANTVMWWMEQSQEAQQTLISKQAISISQALNKLSDYISSVREKNHKNKINIWGNDPDFDMVILDSAFKACNLATPWRFWETRSCRTMVEISERIFGFNKKTDFIRKGTHHAADDDAEYQAQLMQHLYKRLNK
jgi:3'-5' exoribonuclease Rv2179c-like domain